MKKYSAHGLISLWILCLVLFACNKENQVNTFSFKNKKPYEIKNGILSFSSFQYYTNLVDRGTQKEKEDLINELNNNNGYIPLSSSPGLLEKRKLITTNSRLSPTGDPDVDDDIDDIISSPFISKILNADGLVIIGDYIFNVDLLRDSCFAMHTSYLQENNSNYYYGLIYAGNSDNPFVFGFSTDEEVLEILEDWGFPIRKDQVGISATKRCGEPGAKHKKDENNYPFPNSNASLKCKVTYQKAGIYFMLLAKMKLLINGFPVITHYHDLSALTEIFSYRYKAKCRSEIIQPLTTYTWGYPHNESVQNVYSGSRGLSKYDIGWQWKATGGKPENYAVILTKVHAIKDNY